MIKWEYLTIPSADMGEVNPLADIYNIEYIHAGYELSKNVKNKSSMKPGKNYTFFFLTIFFSLPLPLGT